MTSRILQPSRRDVIAALSAATAACARFSLGAAYGAAVSPFNFVDVHCHLFNGCDVPAAKFVLHVVARESGFENYAKVAAFFVRLVAKFAPAAQDELTVLNGHASLVPFPDALDLTDDKLREHVFDTLLDLRAASKTTNRAALVTAPLVRDLNRAGISASAATFTENRALLTPEGSALSVLSKKYGDGIPPLRSKDGSRALSRGLDFSFLSIDKLEIIAKNIVADAVSFESDIGAYLSFAKAFISYRAANLNRLDSGLGLSAKREHALYVPLLIDYDYWLGERHTTPLSTQTSVYAAIAKRANPKTLMNGFVAFDPLRAVAAKRAHDDRPALPRETVLDAINNKGFIGVKLYPPMGFRATGNKDVDLTTFGPVVDPLATSWGMTPAELGGEIDSALDSIYELCARHEIPILAHCSNSQTSFPGSGLRADPSYWGRVLAKSFPGGAGQAPVSASALRLNLAHFGGIWCQSGEKPDSDDEAARCKAVPVAGWPQEVISLAAQYPNVYFDIADVGLLAKDAAAADTLYGFLNGKLSTSALRTLFGNKLLYGTDWMFLSITTPSLERFPMGLSAFAQRLGVAEANVFWTNAARFLGLTTYGMTTARLRAFYAGDSKRLDTLQALVVADPAKPDPRALVHPV